MPRSLPKPDLKESLEQHLYVLILAGGGGTRLWPQSRESSPKQFLKFFGGKSLFQLTLARARKLVHQDHIYISTSAKYVSQIHLHAQNIPGENIIGEPMRRDTALAQGLAALIISHHDPQAVIINLASDHLISPDSIFVSDMLTAAKMAQSGKSIVTVGIKPTFPHTGMGYIQSKGKVGLKFVEKPDLKTAQKFIKSGNYYWNANLYVWKAQLLLELLKKHSPKTTAQFIKIQKSLGTDHERESIQLAFQMAPTISIDYAVSEKLHNFGFVPAHFKWTDVGDWNVVWQNLSKDPLGNSILGNRGKGEFVGINSQNNLFILDKQLITAVGLKDMLVVDTPDAILICPKDDAQSVKKIVETLKDQGLTKYL